MAERSKAPDSKLITFQAHNGTGRSGLLMEARVRITHLTMSLFRTRSLSGPFLVSSVLVYHEIQRPCIECSVGQCRLRTCSYHTQFKCQDRRTVSGARLEVKYLPRTQWERAFWSPNGAWVRIPLLTICFFFSHYLSHKNTKLQRAAGSSILNTRDSVSSIQTPRNFIVKPTSSPEGLSLTLPDFKVTGTLRKQRQVTLICLFCFWFSNWHCLWVQSKLFDENTMANNSLPLTSPDYSGYDENRHLITNCWSPRFLLKFVYHRLIHGMVNLDIMDIISSCQDGRAV